MCCANNCTHGKRYRPLAPLQHSLAPSSGGQHTSAEWLRCAQQTRELLAVLQTAGKKSEKGCYFASRSPRAGPVPASLLQGQAEYCAKFYFRQTFESTQAQLAKVYSASLSHVQYFHKRIKSLVLVTGLNILANFDFNMVQLQFSRSAAYQLGGTMLNSLLNF